MGFLLHILVAFNQFPDSLNFPSERNFPQPPQLSQNDFIQETAVMFAGSQNFAATYSPTLCEATT